MGDLVELVVTGRGGKLATVRPRSPRRLGFVGRLGEWGRLVVFQAGPPTGRPADPEEVEAVRGFTWGASDGEEVEAAPDRAGPSGRALGRAEQIVYLATKGKGRQAERAEWAHPFQVRPLVRVGRSGELELRGRVLVDARGILS
jgi:hypothetical protein